MTDTTQDLTFLGQFARDVRAVARLQKDVKQQLTLAETDPVEARGGRSVRPRPPARRDEIARSTDAMQQIAGRRKEP